MTTSTGLGISTYLSEEVKQEALVRDYGSFVKFLKIAALYNSQVINVSNISRGAGVARTTVERYLEILNDTLIGIYLPAWQPRLKVRSVGHPKFYFFDCGVVWALNGTIRDKVHESEKGQLFETFILNELRSAISYLNIGGELFYWRNTSGNEVDFIWQRGRKVIGIEVKCRGDFRSEYTKSIDELISTKNIDKDYIVYTGEKEITYDNVQVLPVAKFLELIWKGDILG